MPVTVIALTHGTEAANKLLVGDILISVNRVSLNSNDDLQRVFALTETGAELQLILRRGRQPHAVTLTVPHPKALGIIAAASQLNPEKWSPDVTRSWVLLALLAPLFLVMAVALFLWLLETAGSWMFWIVAVICLALVFALCVVLYKWLAKPGLRVARGVLVLGATVAVCIKLLGVLLGIIFAVAFFVSLLFGGWCSSRWGETGLKVALWIIVIGWLIGALVVIGPDLDFSFLSLPTGDGSTDGAKCVYMRNYPLPWFTVRCFPN